MPDAGNRSEALSAGQTPCSARYSTFRRDRPWEPYIGSWDVRTCLRRPSARHLGATVCASTKNHKPLECLVHSRATIN
jgi:hypothetical protein